MDDRIWNRLKEIYHQAVEKPPEERAKLLDDACGGDAALRAELEGLLRVHDRGEPGESPSEISEGPGTVIDRYKILQRIGEGGFGVVYMAEQEEPVRRMVALKIIKLGMDTKQVVARFEAERQALAVMDHPNIATVLDGGATQLGRPYFVMELVKGVPITEYCDQAQLDTAERLLLFQDVCRAVQHAHSKGIIHRDLKPSNILVTLHDGRPVPKVIDFGIAKATDHRLTQKTLFTEFRQMIGTPEYMAPEQAELSGLDIDTRADIYALGVVLYELLTGAKPFDLTMLLQQGYDEVLRTIREVEPPRPSTKLSSMGQELPVVARKRHTQPKLLGRLLRGDLDWIVMKALEKDRARRYETANGFAMDIERHLSDEPVLASPPSRSYRLLKFVRRNRTAVTAAALIVLALAVGAVAATVGMVRAEQAETRAEAEAEKAKTEKAIAEAINEFLNQDLLAAVAPSEDKGRGRDVLMREVLDEAAARIEKASSPGGRFADKPLVEASIRSMLAWTYYRLGEREAAEPHALRLRQLRERELGSEDPATLRCMNFIAYLYYTQGRYDEAERLYLQTLEGRRRVLGEEHGDTLQSMAGLAHLYEYWARYDAAEPLLLKVLEIRRRVLGEGHPDTLSCKQGLGNVYRRQSRYAEAEPLLVEVLETRKRVMGKEHTRTIRAMVALGNLYWRQRRYDEAEALQRKALEWYARVLGKKHSVTLHSMNNLANVYSGQGRLDEAEPLHKEALELRREVLGEAHRDTLVSMSNLAWLYWQQERFDEAEPLFVEALRMRKRVLGEEHQHTLSNMGDVALVHARQGRPDEAVRLLRKALEIQRRVLGKEHPDTLWSLEELAKLYAQLDRRDDALPLYRELLDRRLAAAADVDANAVTLNNAARVLLTPDFEELRDPARALALAERACAMEEKAKGASLWNYLDTLALAQHLSGATARAIGTQKRAISLAPHGASKAAVAKMKATLAKFEAALAKPGDQRSGGG